MILKGSEVCTNLGKEEGDDNEPDDLICHGAECLRVRVRVNVSTWCVC